MFKKIILLLTLSMSLTACDNKATEAKKEEPNNIAPQKTEETATTELKSDNTKE